MPEPESPSPFDEFLTSCKLGDQQAIGSLIQEYGPILLRAIRRRLRRGVGPVLRLLFDSTDFEQIVWVEFLAKGLQTSTFMRREQLIAYLLEMAFHKIATAERDHVHCQKRSLLRQQSLENPDLQAKERLPGHELSPEEAAIFEEEWHRLETIPRRREAQILMLLRQELTYRAIAAIMGLSERTIQRVVARYGHEQDQQE